MKLRIYYIFKGNHPVIGPLFNRSAQILDGSHAERYQLYLADTLSQLARNVDDCNHILSVIESVESGESSDIAIDGLDTTATISKAEVQISITLDDEEIGQLEGRFSLNEFKTAILAWRDFLLLPKSAESEIIVEL